MSQRITLLSKSVTRDAMGGEIITWVDEGDVWAEAEPLRGREYFASKQFIAEDTTRFRVRYQDAITITSEWRLRWREQDYDIVYVVDVNAAQRTRELLCTTAPNV